MAAVSQAVFLLWTVTASLVLMQGSNAARISNEVAPPNHRYVYGNANNNGYGDTVISVNLADLDDLGDLGGALKDAVKGLIKVIGRAEKLVKDPEFGKCAIGLVELSTKSLKLAMDCRRLRFWKLVKDIIKLVRAGKRAGKECSEACHSPKASAVAAALKDEFDKIKAVIHAIKSIFSIPDDFIDFMIQQLDAAAAAHAAETPQ